MSRYFFWAILLITCGYALWRGRKYEQLSALLFIAASVVSVLVRVPLHERYLGVEQSDLVIDSVVTIATVAIALRSDRQDVDRSVSGRELPNRAVRPTARR